MDWVKNYPDRLRLAESKLPGYFGRLVWAVCGLKNRLVGQGSSRLRQLINIYVDVDQNTDTSRCAKVRASQRLLLSHG
jgi:hypothetical protein